MTAKTSCRDNRRDPVYTKQTEKTSDMEQNSIATFSNWLQTYNKTPAKKSAFEIANHQSVQSLTTRSAAAAGMTTLCM
mgnify:FL=1